KLTTLAGQTEFSKLDGGIATKVPSGQPRDSVTPIYYYFNGDGEPVTEKMKKEAIYTAAMTYLDSPDGFTGASSKSMVTLLIDVYNNHGLFVAGKPSGSPKTTFIHIADF